MTTLSAERSSDDGRASTLELFTSLRDEALDPHRRRRLRIEAIQRHLPLVGQCVNGYRPRPEDREDITQVGTIGLIQAVDRFDPTRGVEFPSYAWPTISGEILRYFRDRGSAIRLPRPHHDVVYAVNSSREYLRHELGREPTRSDVADFLGRSRTEVDAALAAHAACRPRSLDSDGDPPAGRPLQLGALDARLEAVVDVHALLQSIGCLPEEERGVILMLYWHGLTQDQAAARLGCSQMHVSRIHRRSIEHLAALLTR